MNTKSVSLAAFSDSWEQARWARSGWVAAPFGALQDDACGRVRGAAALILAFAAACGPLLPQPPRAFVGALLASRYAPLDGGGGEAEAAAAAPAACLLGRPLRNDKPRLRAEAALKSAVLSTASAVAALLREPDEAAGGNTHVFVTLECNRRQCQERERRKGAWRQGAESIRYHK